MNPVIEFLKAIDRTAGQAPKVLLDTILRECRAITRAEAGTIYLLRDSGGTPVLEPMSLQNDSLRLEPVQFVVPLNRRSIAGHVALTGESLLIDDAYAIPADRDYGFNSSFDDAKGYRTVSVACIPLRRHDGGVGAVVQLLNRRDGASGKAVPFSPEQAEFIAAAGVVISGVIERAEMIERLAESNRELRERAARIEALQARTEAALAEVEKSNSAKSHLLACIGHELKTPLNAIIGFSELLRNEGFGPLGHPSYRGFAADVADGGQKLLGIVNDILAIVTAESRTAARDADYETARGCIAEACRPWVERAAEANIAFALDIAPEAGDCTIDHAGLQTALDRLLDNAVKFTPPGGRITVDARPGADRGLRVTVADTGIGMAAKDIPTALAPFGQVDSSLSRSHEGAGLGLSLADALTRGMNGTLVIESAPDAGTAVTLAFPPPASPPAAASPGPLAGPLAGGGDAVAMWVAG